MNLFEYVGQRIRDLRLNYNSGQGLSQEALARAVGVASNTISRWETATYRPSLEDLDNLARFFGVSILAFFPREEAETDEQISALLRTARQLQPDDLEELRRYAEFRQARSLYSGEGPPRAGRKRKQRQ
jgi:transcriptional regulator with XRE-family HTH domain